MMLVPVSNLNVTTSLTVASANFGLLTLREKKPFSAADDTTPMTSPAELKAARVPCSMAASLIVTVTLRLAVVSPLLSSSAHDCSERRPGDHVGPTTPGSLRKESDASIAKMKNGILAVPMTTNATT